MNILILEPHLYSDEAVAIYQKMGAVTQITDHESLPNSSPEVHILVMRDICRADKAFLDRFPALRVIGCAMTGTDHFDHSEMTRRRISLFYLKEQVALLERLPAVAEKIMGYIIGLSHQIFAGNTGVRKGIWSYEPFIGRQLSGKTLGLIGYGRLGKMVCQRAQAFGLNVVANDPLLSERQRKEALVLFTDIKTLLGTCDYISIQVPLNRQTNRMMGVHEFSLMKEGAIYVNAARGDLNCEKALLEALKSGRLSGAALDVMSSEHRDGRHLEGNPLIAYAKEHPNLVITPHIGGFVQEGMKKAELFIAQNIHTAISEGKLDYHEKG